MKRWHGEVAIPREVKVARKAAARPGPASAPVVATPVAAKGRSSVDVILASRARCMKHNQPKCSKTPICAVQTGA